MLLPVGASETSTTPDRDYSEALRRHRRERGLSQNQLAVRLGVTQQSIARWEHGLPPRRDLMDRIEQELGSSTTEVRALGEVIRLPRDDAALEAERIRKLDDFLDGCIDIVKRGNMLPPEIMLLVARKLRAFDEDDS